MRTNATTCTNKRAYFYKCDADKEVRKLRRNGGYARPYECNICYQWHITSKKFGIRVVRNGEEMTV